MTDFAACAERLIDAYNAKDFDTLTSLVAPDVDMAHFNRGAAFSSAEELVGVMKIFADGLAPDRKFQPAERVTTSGNTVVREGYWTATATDDIPGFAAKDEAISLRLCSVMIFDDNGILVEWKDHG